jgi:predicted GNAT family acetyltransferase
MSDEDAKATDDAERSRFSLKLENGEAIAIYRRAGPVLTITHTEVPPELEGQGIASALVSQMFDIVRDRGEKVVPACAFVRGYVERHPELRDLIA